MSTSTHLFENHYCVEPHILIECVMFLTDWVQTERFQCTCGYAQASPILRSREIESSHFSLVCFPSLSLIFLMSSLPFSPFPFPSFTYIWDSNIVLEQCASLGSALRFISKYLLALFCCQAIFLGCVSQTPVPADFLNIFNCRYWWKFGRSEEGRSQSISLPLIFLGGTSGSSCWCL